MRKNLPPSRVFSVPDELQNPQIPQGLITITTCSDKDMETIVRLRKQMVQSGALPSDAAVNTSHASRSLEEIVREFEIAVESAQTEKDYNAQIYDESVYGHLEGVRPLAETDEIVDSLSREDEEERYLQDRRQVEDS